MIFLTWTVCRPLNFLIMAVNPLSFMLPLIDKVEQMVTDSMETLHDTNMADYHPRDFVELSRAMNNLSVNEYQANQANERAKELYSYQVNEQQRLINSQREYEQKMLRETPSVNRQAMIDAGMNPVWQDGQSTSYGFMGSSPSSPSMPSGAQGSPIDFYGGQKLSLEKQRFSAEKFKLFVDSALQIAAATRDSQRLSNESKTTEVKNKETLANIDRIYADADWKDADIKRINQTNSLLLQQNEKNRLEIEYLSQTLSNRVERELLQNTLLRSQDNVNKAYATLLDAETDNTKLLTAINRIVEQREDIALNIDRALEKTRIGLERKEFDLLKNEYKISVGRVVHSALLQLEDSREIDLQKLNEMVMREIWALQKQNEKYDLDFHSTQVMLETANQLTSIIGNIVSSGSLVRGNQIKAYRANTQRMQFNAGGREIMSPTRGRFWQPNASDFSSSYLRE